MDARTPVLAILSSDEYRSLADGLASSLGYSGANIIIGSPLEAVALLSNQDYSPKYLFIDIAARGQDILPEIDQLAEFCEADTRVAVMGQSNDIGIYRALKERGVLEYFSQTPGVGDLRAIMQARGAGKSAGGQIIAFIGASAGDGCSTLAVNTAYALAAEHKKPTVIVDLDYQFGMVAKQLDLAPKYGIKEIFDHPERGIDEALVNRMIVKYRDTLDVVAAPQPLYYLPHVTPESARDLISALQQKYEYIVLDLPHLWSNWTASTLSMAQHIVLVSQLWLKSVNHASRLLTAWQKLGFKEKNVLTVINRSGSKFKEAISARDFERVTGRRIDLYVPNDIRTIARAEHQATTIIELGNSLVATEIRRLTDMLVTEQASTRQLKSIEAKR